jgi:hypothetical protein
MSTAPGGASRVAAARTGQAGSRGRSTAQWYCLIAGATLLLVGILGFLVEAKFDTSSGSDPGSIDGENFIIFEVNGFHNVVHLLSGAFLLFMSSSHARARTGALAFGAIYGLVALIGLIDGHDLFGIVPINPADNVLHIVLAGSGLAVGLLADRDRRDVRDDATSATADGVTSATATGARAAR